MEKSIKRNRRAIIVLGMYRSGASALTRTVNMLGVDLGNNLMHPCQGNNGQGMCEHRDIYQSNDRLLHELNSSRDDVNSLPEGWWDFDAAQKYKLEIIRILERDFAESHIWGVKDPVICRLLPVWHPLLEQTGSKPYFLIIVRNPLEVMASLAKYDGFSKGKSCFLWLKHLLEAEKGTRNMSRLFVTYEELLSNWKGMLSRVQTAFRFKWPVNLKEAAPQVEAFNMDTLYHNRVTDTDFIEDKRLFKWISDAYVVAADTIGDEDSRLIKTMDNIEAELKEVVNLCKPVVINIGENYQTNNKALQNRNHKLNDINNCPEIFSRDEGYYLSTIDHLQTVIKEKDAHIQQLDANLRKLKNEVYTRWTQGEHHRLSHEAILNSRAWKIGSQLRQVYINFKDIKSRIKIIQYLFTRQYRLISKSGLFDTAYYLAQDPGIAQSGMNPLAHYLSVGVHEGKDPNPMFNSSYYFNTNLDVAESRMNPLAHYISIGAHEGRDPNPLFDTSYYLEHNPDVVESGINPLRHYLEIGAWEGRLPCLLNEGDLDPQILKICQTRLDDPKALEFDEDFYSKFYTDLKSIDDPEKDRRYYFVDEKVERRCASFHEFLSYLPAHPLDVPIDFSADGYFQLNPDVAEAEPASIYHALAHYLRHGKKEGRLYSNSQVHLRPNKFLPEPTPYSCNLPIHDLKDHTAVCVLVHIYDTEIWPELATYIHNFGQISFDIYINIVDTQWSELLHSKIRNEFPKAHIYITPNKGRDIGGFFALLSNIDTENYDVLCLLHTKKSPHLPPLLGKKWRTDLLNAILHNEQKAEENVSLFLHDETVGLIGSRLWFNTELNSNEKAYFSLLEKLSIQVENRKCEYLSGTIMLVRPNVLKKIYEIIDYDEFEMGDNKPLEFHLDGQLAHAVERVIGCVVRHLGYRAVWR